MCSRLAATNYIFAELLDQVDLLVLVNRVGLDCTLLEKTGSLNPVTVPSQLRRKQMQCINCQSSVRRTYNTQDWNSPELLSSFHSISMFSFLSYVVLFLRKTCSRLLQTNTLKDLCTSSEDGSRSTSRPNANFSSSVSSFSKQQNSRKIRGVVSFPYPFLFFEQSKSCSTPFSDLDTFDQQIPSSHAVHISQSAKL